MTDAWIQRCSATALAGPTAGLRLGPKLVSGPVPGSLYRFPVPLRRRIASRGLVFQHMEADTHFGAGIVWVRRTGAMGGEQAADNE
jgi:hypothetical protein